MNKIEKDILKHLYNREFVNQRNLSKEMGLSLGVVNKSLRNLIDNGYLNNNYTITDKTSELFINNQPKNAIILAAGFGMRMIPINRNSPKALLEIDGERLIDRIIKQLHEAGVFDITVVVGYMKDAFEYLLDEDGINLVYNKEYASKNNITSLNLVSDKLDNTYIVPCDVWCNNNPFDKNELYSWYMVSDLVDENSDVRVNRKSELVKISGELGGNAMIGISYLCGDEAKTVRDKLNQYSKDSNYDDKFWEEALYENDKMIVYPKVVLSNDVVEINTYEQLRDLDSNSNQLKSNALEIICNVFNCDLDEIVDIEMLKNGMTNRSFFFRIENSGKYIMRIPGEGTDQLIDRKQEAEVYQTIKGLKLCDDPVYINPDNGYKITKYIENVHCCDPNDVDDLRKCMQKLRKFHDLKLKVSHTFDIFEKIDFYESLWGDIPSIYQDYKTTKENVLSLKEYVDKNAEDYQLTHIDAVPDNFLFDPNIQGELAIQLTDWEYAGMQDKHVDIAMFIIYSCYNKEQADRLIDIYFEDEGGCDVKTRAKIYCYIAMCGLLWSNWCEYKRNLGVEFGEYSLYQYRYAKKFYQYAKELMN